MVLAAAIGMIENSACLCQYADRALTIPEIVELFNIVAGYDYTIDSMMEAGTRVFHLKRCINYRLGFTSAEDGLTPRMLEPAGDGEPAGIQIEFDEMKKLFYELMEMDPEKGIAVRERLIALGLSDEADFAWSSGV